MITYVFSLKAMVSICDSVIVICCMTGSTVFSPTNQRLPEIASLSFLPAITYAIEFFFPLCSSSYENVRKSDTLPDTISDSINIVVYLFWPSAALMIPDFHSACCDCAEYDLKS